MIAMLEIVLVILLALLVLVAITIVALKVATALFHVFKDEEPPAENDSDWSRDQGKDAK